MAAAEAPRAAIAARRGCGAAGEPGPPPVLILSHFCPRPFVCFGALRPGASRALPLAVLNPNAEPAAVALPPGPAAERGFLVRPRAFRLQPKEKIVISVVWTPVKEGRVREVLTFVVNDILKHEVILLGNAEQPRKKKRSLWDTIKKKEAPASSGHKKRIPDIPSVNQTFSVLPRADRVRSPLQACENLGVSEGCAPAASDSLLLLQENRIPISPISPALEDCHGDACLPLCVRRSTTYTALRAPVGGQLWAPGGAPACQEFSENVTPESSVDSLTDDVNGPMEEAGKRVLTPNCPSPWGVPRSPGGFLSPGSFLRSGHGAGHEPDVFPKRGPRPRPLEPDTTHGTYRAILSPDSFLKDNYGLSQKLESEPSNPFVSPNQFVRDNMPHLSVAQPACQLSPLSKGNSRAPPSPPGQKESEDLPLIPGSRGSNSPEAVFEEPAALEAVPDGSGFTKQKRPGLPAAGAAAGPDPGAQPPRRPILSATVTKPRPPGPRVHSDTGAPRARRCLRGAVGGCGSPEGDRALRPPLPVIDPAGSSSPGSGRAPPSPQPAFAAARKRKSWGSGEDTHRAPAGHPEGRESKRTHVCPPEPRTSTARKSRVPVTPGTRADSLALKTPNSKTHRRTPRMVPVAQASLTFIKRLKTDIPRHPMPFAAKNVFYDERWKEKQQLGLTWWLNFLLTPDDLAVKTQVPEVNAATLLLGAESHHKASVARAPTKEEVSLRAYTARRRLNRLRHAACRLFTADGMVQAIRKLEGEIAARRLAVRRDRRLWKDVGGDWPVLGFRGAAEGPQLAAGLQPAVAAHRPGDGVRGAHRSGRQQRRHGAGRVYPEPPAVEPRHRRRVQTPVRPPPVQRRPRGSPLGLHAQEVRAAGLLPGPRQALPAHRPRPLSLLQRRRVQGEQRRAAGLLAELPQRGGRPVPPPERPGAARQPRADAAGRVRLRRHQPRRGPAVRGAPGARRGAAHAGLGPLQAAPRARHQPPAEGAQRGPRSAGAARPGRPLTGRAGERHPGQGHRGPAPGEDAGAALEDGAGLPGGHRCRRGRAKGRDRLSEARVGGQEKLACALPPRGRGSPGADGPGAAGERAAAAGVGAGRVRLLRRPGGQLHRVLLGRPPAVLPDPPLPPALRAAGRHPPAHLADRGVCAVRLRGPQLLVRVRGERPGPVPASPGAAAGRDSPRGAAPGAPGEREEELPAGELRGPGPGRHPGHGPARGHVQHHPGREGGDHLPVLPLRAAAGPPPGEPGRAAHPGGVAGAPAAGGAAAPAGARPSCQRHPGGRAGLPGQTAPAEGGAGRAGRAEALAGAVPAAGSPAG